MSITKPFINKFLSLMLVLSVVLAGLLPSTAVYASEVNTPGSGRSIAELTADGLIMDVTVPTNVLIYVDEHGEVTTPDYLPIINNSAAPVFVHSLTVTPQNGWTLDPTNTDYTNFKVNQKNYWIAFNGLDPSIGPIALATPINGSDSLNLVLSADVAPQKTAINSLNIGEIVITFDWDAAEGAQEPVIPPETGGFTVGDVYHEYADGYGDFVFIPLLTGGVGDYRVIIVAEGTDPETQALADEVVYKESEESCTPGVPLPGYNPEQTYEVYVTYVDDEESETIMKVLLAAYGSETGDDDSGSGGNQEFGFSVEGATHVGYKTFALTLTVTEPDNYLFAAVPPNAPIPSPLSPPPASCLEYIYDAGVHELEIVFSYATNDMTEADIYIWRLNDYDHIGPVKVEVREAEGEDSETENTEPNGEYIPEGYVLATDADFSGTQDGYFKYIGSDDYVVIPHVIKGVPITSYGEMFKGTGVKGVASDNPAIFSMDGMFENSQSSSLELTYLNTSGVVWMRYMFRGSQASSLDLSNFDTSSVTWMGDMFNNCAATTINLTSFDVRNVTQMNSMFAYSKASILDLSSFDISNLSGENMSQMFRECSATIGYARTQEDADIFNATALKPHDLTFVVK